MKKTQRERFVHEQARQSHQHHSLAGAWLHVDQRLVVTAVCSFADTLLCDFHLAAFSGEGRPRKPQRSNADGIDCAGCRNNRDLVSLHTYHPRRLCFLALGVAHNPRQSCRSRGPRLDLTRNCAEKKWAGHFERPQ
ncbi:hypothetical protein EBR21_08730 [bacterium]|nr:hypothetical protein [bacterium]